MRGLLNQGHDDELEADEAHRALCLTARARAIPETCSSSPPAQMLDFEPPPAVEIAPSRTRPMQTMHHETALGLLRRGSLYQRHSVVMAQAGG